MLGQSIEKYLHKVYINSDIGFYHIFIYIILQT